MSNKKELNKVDINVQFEESPTRINITSGEGIKTLFGKIRKYFSDLHSVAFSGSYEDLENKPTIPEIPDVSTKMDKDNPVGTGELSIEGNGTFGGKVSVGANVTPTEDNDLVTKKYVDDNSTIKSVDCTRAEYDAMEYHDPDTYYNVIDDDNGLATHEMDGLMSKEDKIKLDGMSGGDNTINGIPVDLTGIYNTQVIGYDETQGKLVPMINVARTETVLPTTETPQPWTVEGSGNWTISSTDKYPSAGGTWAETLGETLNVIAVSTRPYLLSEFTTLSATMNAGASYSRFDFTSKFQLSKTQDFSIIDAEMAGTSTLDITALKGYYYWRWIVDGVCTLATSDRQATVSASISKLSFS